MELDIYNLQGSKTGSFNVSEDAFGGEVSPALLHRVVVSYEANLRQGSACTKNRAERAGSGKKLWKQKGTGRARMGSIRSPLWRGGGVTFGPKPKDYRMDMSKKERRKALLASLRGKMIDGQIRLLETFDLPEVKTKLIASFVKNAELPAGSVMFVSADHNVEFIRASRNIEKISSSPAKDLNALSVLKANTLVFEKSAFEDLLK